MAARVTPTAALALGCRCSRVAIQILSLACTRSRRCLHSPLALLMRPPGNMQRQEPRPHPPPPPRPRPQYQQQQYERKQERLQLQRAQPRQVYQQYQQHLQQHQPPAQQALYQSRFPPAEQPQRQEQPITSPSRSPQTSTASMSSPASTVSLSYSSLMRDQMTSEPEAGMENIQIDEEWIERNGAFACIWALTYKLPTKEAEEMAQAIMSPPTYNKRG